MIIQDAIEKLRAAEVDFLRGDEAYKYRWAQHERRTHTVLAWRRKFAGRASEAEFLLRRRLSPWKQRVQILWESAGQHWARLLHQALGSC
jgi:CelD/BcsL family acetyltransferase involved in cellulose biosynthesis